MMRTTSLNCRLAKWAIFLSQYDMQFMPQKVVKGQAVADFLVDHLVSRSSKIYDDPPDEITEACVMHASSEEQVWQLFFDDASRTGLRGSIVAGVG